MRMLDLVLAPGKLATQTKLDHYPFHHLATSFLNIYPRHAEECSRSKAAHKARAQNEQIKRPGERSSGYTASVSNLLVAFSALLMPKALTSYCLNL